MAQRESRQKRQGRGIYHVFAWVLFFKSPIFHPILTPEIALYITLLSSLLSAVRTHSTHLLAISVCLCIAHLCCFVMSAIHHEPEGNTESINSDMQNLDSFLLLRRMTEFVTLEVSNGKTNCSGAVAVKYVYYLQKNHRYLLIAVQYLFCFFPHTQTYWQGHTRTHCQGECDNALHRPIKADIKQSVIDMSLT